MTSKILGLLIGLPNLSWMYDVRRAARTISAHHTSSSSLSTTSLNNNMMGIINMKCITILLALVVYSSVTSPFIFGPPSQSISRQQSIIITSLYAKKTSTKQKKKKNKNASTSGFGGAATEDCPCGSGLGYMKCCGKLHKDAKAYAE